MIRNQYVLPKIDYQTKSVEFHEQRGLAFLPVHSVLRCTQKLRNLEPRITVHVQTEQNVGIPAGSMQEQIPGSKLHMQYCLFILCYNRDFDR